MAEQEIKIVAKLVDETSAQFKAMSDNVAGQSKKTADKVVGDNQRMATAAKQSTGETIGKFAASASAAKSFGNMVAGGDVTGAIVQMGQVAAQTGKAISLSFAAATAGISLAMAGIQLAVQLINKELEENQKRRDEAAKKWNEEQARQKALRQSNIDGLFKAKEIEAALIKNAEEREIALVTIKYARLIKEQKDYYEERKKLAGNNAVQVANEESAYQSDRSKLIRARDIEIANINQERQDKEISDERQFQEAYQAALVQNRNDAWEKKKAIAVQEMKMDQQVQEIQKANDEEEFKQYKFLQQQQENTVAGVANMLGAFAQLNTALKGDAELSKALAVTQAIINTAVGVTKAYAQGGVLGFVTGSAIAAAGAAQVATISAQKFATGGVVNGPSTGDQVPIRANGGEMVLTTDQQRTLFNMANGRGGGNGGAAINIVIPPSSRVDYDAAQLLVKQFDQMARDGAFDKAYNLKAALR